MSTLLLKFTINLEEDIFQVPHHYGPLFHRWLPEGEKDALIVDTGDSHATLKVWFERLGFVQGDFICFDYQRREVDSKIIPTQAILDGGPLFGSLEIRELSQEELDSVVNDKKGDDAYVKLGKRVVKKLVYPSVHRLLGILRTHYGQHWIPEISDWDSRKESLGAHCESLRLKWSSDNGKTWKPFLPDDPTVLIAVTISKDYSGYLTEKDWKDLAETVQTGFEPSLGAVLLSRAYQLMDRGNLKYAFIEGVTSLELVISEYVKAALGGSTKVAGSMPSFFELPLQAQVTAIAALSGRAAISDVEKALEAIDIRNKIVHQGSPLPSGSEEKVLGLLRTVGVLVGGPLFRFLTASPGNAVKSLEEWEKGQ